MPSGWLSADLQLCAFPHPPSIHSADAQLNHRSGPNQASKRRLLGSPFNFNRSQGPPARARVCPSVRSPQGTCPPPAQSLRQVASGAKERRLIHVELLFAIDLGAQTKQYPCASS